MIISHKTQDFDDLTKATVYLLGLRLPDGPGRCVGAERCLKRDLKSSRSHLTSKMGLQERLVQSVTLNQGPSYPPDSSV